MVLLMMGLRGVGDSLTPLWFMGLSVVLDSTLNPVFILGLGPAPRMGIAGSATATLLANYHLADRDGRSTSMRATCRSGCADAELRFLIPNRALRARDRGQGLSDGPADAGGIVRGGLAMIGLVNRGGVVVTAAYGVTQQLWTYIQMPAMAIGAARSARWRRRISAPAGGIGSAGSRDRR